MRCLTTMERIEFGVFCLFSLSVRTEQSHVPDYNSLCLLIKKDRARDPTAGWFLWIIWVGQAEEAMLDHRESVHLADGVLKQYLPVCCNHSCM